MTEDRRPAMGRNAVCQEPGWFQGRTGGLQRLASKRLALSSMSQVPTTNVPMRADLAKEMEEQAARYGMDLPTFLAFISRVQLRQLDREFVSAVVGLNTHSRSAAASFNRSYADEAAVCCRSTSSTRAPSSG